MRIFMPCLSLVLLGVGIFFVHYDIDEAVKNSWSGFIRIVPRYLALLLLLVLIYQIVYVKYLGATKYDLKFPPVKLIVSVALMTPFYILTVQYLFLLFHYVRGGIFEVDPEVESELAPIFFGTLRVVLFGPAVEELVLRVMMISQAQTRKGLFFAVVFSSLLFSVLHLSHLFAHLLTGVLYALVLISTRNIWCSIICHALHNLSVSCFGFIQYMNPSLVETDVTTGIWRVDGVVVGVAAVMFLCGCLHLYKNKTVFASIIHRKKR